MHFKPIYQYKYAFTPDDLNSVLHFGLHSILINSHLDDFTMFMFVEINFTQKPFYDLAVTKGHIQCSKPEIM